MKKQTTRNRLFRIFKKRNNLSVQKPRRCDILRAMEGLVLETLTDLSPSGYILGPDKELIDATCLGKPIKAGQKVVVDRSNAWIGVFVKAYKQAPTKITNVHLQVK